MVRVSVVLAICLVWLTGCASAPPFGEPAKPADAGAAAGLLGSDAHDDLSLGKKHFKASNFALAEQHFRKAVESHPKDGEAWVGLAAAYDRLQRFDLADRAYKEATAILGPTPEILNNQGYSYILRGDYTRARQTLRKAQAADPKNPYILNNMKLLQQVASKGKGVQ